MRLAYRTVGQNGRVLQLQVVLDDGVLLVLHGLAVAGGVHEEQRRHPQEKRGGAHFAAVADHNNPVRTVPGQGRRIQRRGWRAIVALLRYGAVAAIGWRRRNGHR